MHHPEHSFDPNLGEWLTCMGVMVMLAAAIRPVAF
jgi:hypothetical protein